MTKKEHRKLEKDFKKIIGLWIKMFQKKDVKIKLSVPLMKK